MLTSRLAKLSTTAALGCVLLLAGPTPAQAQLSEATALELQNELKALADALLTGNSKLKFEGEPKVVVEGDAYMASLPTLRVELDAGDYARLPALTARLVPQANQTYNFTINLPTPLLSIYDLTDVPTHTAAVEAQDISGVWDSQNDVIRAMSADLRGLSLTEQAKNYIAFSLDRLKLQTNTAITADNKMSGNTLLTASAARAYDAKETELFNLAGLAISYKVDGADWVKMQKLRANAGSQLGGNEISATDVAGLAGKVSGVGGKSAFALVLNNLAGRYVSEEKGTTDVMLGQLAQLRFLASSGQDASGTFNGDVHYHHDGLLISGLPSALISQIIPATMDFKARLENIPLDAVLSSFEQTGVPQVADSPGTINTTASVKRTLEQAGARLVLSKLELTAPLLSVTSSGAFEASEAARFGTIGRITTRVGKLAELMARASKEAAEPATADQQPDPIAANLMMGLALVQGFGAPVAGDTTGLRDYVLEVTKSGEFNLNGANLMNLILGGALTP